MGRHVILEKLEKNVCNKQKVGMRNVEKMHIGSNVQIVGLKHKMRKFEKKKLLQARWSMNQRLKKY